MTFDMFIGNVLPILLIVGFLAIFLFYNKGNYKKMDLNEKKRAAQARGEEYVPPKTDMGGLLRAGAFVLKVLAGGDECECKRAKRKAYNRGYSDGQSSRF